MKFACLLLLTSCSGMSQTVEGTVVNVVTGGGIAGAKVVLQQEDKAAYSATTDAEGHFRIEGVQPGTYFTRYSAQQYFFPGSGPTGVPRIQVGASGAPLRIEGRMIPLSRISGRVIDERGDPVVKARVALTTNSAFWAAQTDAKGNFELGSVIPVNTGYSLSVAPPADWKAPGPDQGTGQSRAWARTFYPSTVFGDLAVPLVPQIGGDLLGLEVKLLAVPVHAIRGVLLSPGGVPVPKGRLTLWGAGPERDPAYGADSTSDGTFEFPAVVDGDWHLVAVIESGGVDLAASEWLSIKGREIDNLKVRLSAPFSLKGRVLLETREGLPSPAPPDLTLIEQHRAQIVFRAQSISVVSPGPDGRFVAENLYPATYRILPGGSPPPFYLDSVRLGDVLVTDEVELSAGSPELTIVYRNDGGSVRGTVEKCGMGQVWLIPRDYPRVRNSFAACDVAADGSGRFQISGIRPGEYYALAVPGEELWSGNVDATFIRRATTVTVRASETTQIDLKPSSSR